MLSTSGTVAPIPMAKPPNCSGIESPVQPRATISSHTSWLNPVSDLRRLRTALPSDLSLQNACALSRIIACSSENAIERFADLVMVFSNPLVVRARAHQ